MTLSTRNKYIRRLRVTLNLEYWRTHDFRRLLSTGASELGVMPHVVEKMSDSYFKLAELNIGV
jgi:hypothetical protein